MSNKEKRKAWQDSLPYKKIKNVDPSMSRDDLLASKETYWLTGVCDILNIKPYTIVEAIKDIERPFAEVGVGRFGGGNFYADMERFSNWYTENFGVFLTELGDGEKPMNLPKTVKDIRDLFDLSGIYYWRQVIKYSPYPEATLRVAVRKEMERVEAEGKSCREEIGVFRLGDRNTLYVDMERYRDWFMDTLIDKF